MAEQKTNAMRILDQMKIPYGTIYYEVEGEFTNGNDVAKKTGVPEDQDFKTLVAQGKSERYCVFVIPVSHEMNMKKAARSVGEKSVDLIPVKDINRITGYVRGGCSPLGIKRQCRTVIDSTAKEYDSIYVSGGKLGFACPGLASRPMDLDTAAPAPDLRILTIDSPVSYMMPEATMLGFSNSRLPTLVLSELMCSRLG